MRKNKILCLIFAVLICLSGLTACSDTPQAPTSISEITLSEQQISNIQIKSHNHLTENKFSGTALVTLKEQEIFAEAFGFTDASKSEKNQLDTKYQIGSLTKTYTGIAILQLVAQGKLKLSDTLDKFFEGKNYLSTITIQHLLEMRSGLGSYTVDILSDEYYYSNINKYIGTDSKHPQIKELVEEIILKRGVESTTGNFNYSHSDYYLLGLIIEDVTNMEYHEYITENIIEPLNLKNTSFINNDVEATGFRIDLQEWRTHTQHPFYNNIYVMFSSLGITSDVADLNTVYKAILSNEILGEYKDKLSCLETIIGSSSDYSCGFYIANNCIYSEGNSNLHCSNSYINTDTKEITILLSNYNDSDKVETLTKDIYNFANAKINGIIAENIQ